MRCVGWWGGSPCRHGDLSKTQSESQDRPKMHDWQHDEIRECVGDGEEETMVGQLLNRGLLRHGQGGFAKCAQDEAHVGLVSKIKLLRAQGSGCQPRFVSEGSDVAWMQKSRHKPPGGYTWSRSAGSVHPFCPCVMPWDAFGLASRACTCI